MSLKMQLTYSLEWYGMITQMIICAIHIYRYRIKAHWSSPQCLSPWYGQRSSWTWAMGDDVRHARTAGHNAPRIWFNSEITSAIDSCRKFSDYHVNDIIMTFTILPWHVWHFRIYMICMSIYAIIPSYSPQSSPFDPATPAPRSDSLLAWWVIWRQSPVENIVFSYGIEVPYCKKSTQKASWCLNHVPKLSKWSLLPK